jgi:hypothetical protein
MAALAALLTWPAACFNPAQPPCAFSCAYDGKCPSGYTCGSDLLCHHDGDQGMCGIATDGATDGAASDGPTTDAAPGQ